VDRVVPSRALALKYVLITYPEIQLQKEPSLNLCKFHVYGADLVFTGQVAAGTYFGSYGVYQPNEVAPDLCEK
jgi:hypothetical protein